MTREHLSPDAINSRAAVDDKMSEHDSALTALEIKTKYIYALTSCVHMAIDADTPMLQALSPLSGGATQAAADARLNLLKTSLLEHCNDVGASITTDGVHQNPDRSSDFLALSSIPGASNLATCKTLIAGMRDAIIGHGYETLYSNWHFHDDTGFGGGGFALTHNSPVTLGDCITDINDILTALISHYLLASQ
jgi:hypothetical protein